jgi:type III secretion system low calcium response chaperone LcrH/SycD
MHSDQEKLKKSLRKIAMNIETCGMLSPHDFNNEDVSLLYSLGFNLYEREDYATSKEIFQRLVLSRPYEKKFWMALGACHQMTRHFELALESWAMASFIDEHDPLPHFHATECYLALESPEEAFLALEETKKRLQDADIDLFEKIQALEKAWLIRR